MLWRGLRRRRRDAGGSALLVVGHQLCEAAVPVLVGVAIDRALATGDGSALLLWLSVVAATFVLLATCAGLGYWLLSRAEYSIRRDLRLDLVTRAVDPRGGLGRETWSRGNQLVGTAEADAARAATVSEGVALLAGATAALLAGGAVLFSTSAVLAVTVLVGALLVLGAAQLLARPLIGRAEKEQESLAAATAMATDLVTGLRVLKGIGAEPAAASAYDRVSRHALAARLHAARLEGGYVAASGLLTGAFLVAVAFVGGVLALDGRISPGALVAAVGLAQFLMEPLERLTVIAPILAGSRAAAGRVARLLDAPPAVGDGGSALPELGRAVPVAVRRGRLAIEVAAGEHLGVVVADDPDAAGLLSLLGRDERDGHVLVEGTDLAEVALADARATVVVARHDAVLFEGSVRDNLRPASGGESVAAPVLEASAADDVVESIEGGLDADVGERGRRLSGGQRQRLILARALATEAPVLVLHDPTTAVDPVTEDRIAAGVHRHRAGRTTVLVTSSPALLARCDRVLLVREGTVVASGTHASLVDHEAYRVAVLS